MNKRMCAICALAAGMLSALSVALLAGCAQEDAPQNAVTVTFRAEGEKDVVLTTEYGGSVTPPEVPEKAGLEGWWDREEFRGFRRDTVVTAVYATEGLEYTLVESGGKSYYAVSKGEMKEGVRELRIPSVCRGTEVKQIAAEGFSETAGLKTVVLPEGITDIGKMAFYKCSQLETVNIPFGVTKIGEFSFSFCESLKAIDFPASVKSIGSYAFIGCDALKEVDIPDSVENLGSSVFNQCEGLVRATLPDGLTCISDALFSYCSSLSEIEIPAGVTSIGALAFLETALRTVVLPENITRIEFATFWGCSALKTVVLPESLTDIEESAFRDCILLKTIELPDGLKNIGLKAFAECYSIRSLTIPASVTEIGSSAFAEWDASSDDLCKGPRADARHGLGKRLFRKRHSRWNA